MENRPAEYLCYLFAVVFVMAGTVVLVVGLVRSEGLIALAGGVSNILFWPAMAQARAIRKENMVLRTLEVPLSAAANAEAAAETLRKVFAEVFSPKKKDG
jgi:hypothetical protein